MLRLQPRMPGRLGMVCLWIFFIFPGLQLSELQAQAPARYEPTLESLDRHPLPAWFADAKLGIFIHYGLYSVPGWAPLVHPGHDFSSQ